MTEYERSKVAVWHYPVSNFYTRLWADMSKNAVYEIPNSIDDAITKIRNGSRRGQNQFALLGRYKLTFLCT